MHTYILFSSNMISMKKCVGMHLVSLAILPLPLLFVYFLSYHPYLLVHAFYTCLCYFHDIIFAESPAELYKVLSNDKLIIVFVQHAL